MSNDKKPLVEIEDDQLLWRRIPDPWLVEDENMGCIRPSTQAFEHFEMSTYLADIVLAERRTAQSILQVYGNRAMAKIFAGFCREKSQDIQHEPVVGDPDNNIDAESSHTLVIGAKPKSVRKALVHHAMSLGWVVRP